jgi:NADPH:quinone reductase-like Zn-dependent oxidoreductase
MIDSRLRQITMVAAHTQANRILRRRCTITRTVYHAVALVKRWAMVKVMMTRTLPLTMTAVVHDRYGDPDVLRIDEVTRPTPAAGEVLVEVHTATVNRTDCGFRLPRPTFVRFFSGVRRPKNRILGTEFAGVVVDKGADVTKFAIGDRVFGVNERFGAHAQYMRIDQDVSIAAIPAGRSFTEMAGVADGGTIATACLERSGVAAGQRILIYGASGAIGTSAVQLAKHIGAHVTAVCNTTNIDVVTSLGPDAVIDYTTSDFIADLTSAGETFDVVFDAVGKSSFRRCRKLVRRGGRYVSTDLGFMWQNPFLALATLKFAPKQVQLPIPKYTQDKVEALAALVASGDFRAVVDRTYPLDQIVEATRYVETEQKVGNVLIDVGTAG